jgi:hypothetical protein
MKLRKRWGCGAGVFLTPPGNKLYLHSNYNVWDMPHALGTRLVQKC